MVSFLTLHRGFRFIRSATGTRIRIHFVSFCSETSLSEVATEFNAYRLDSLDITETRWADNGRLTLGIEETLLYSGHEEENANPMKEVGLMLSRQVTKSLLGWQPERFRIVSAVFKTNKKKINLWVINCYAPTNEIEEDVKEQFYAKLQDVPKKSKAEDITILMGDFNSQRGNYNKV
ncbi:craniofacial development protein 2 [Elysia marginata]|uniref:Craniofacial development protein 2 n=1 Tax=Elysia marginata TaxID=1093978 RepID=A0AAV4HEW3_9GAST|nr:craniofacial development protein 2 [Elysia marginata]